MRPEITIEYCTAWNYEPKAVGLADKILGFKQKLGSVRLVPSGGGAFEVLVDGRKIYSKLEKGEFPEVDAILKLIRARV